MTKRLFSIFVLTLQFITFGYVLLVSIEGLSWPLAGLVIMVMAPLVQQLWGFDTLRVPHHKVRLPFVSLLVFSGLAVVLVSVDRQSSALWLALMNVGGFLLDTYWARDRRISTT